MNLSKTRTRTICAAGGACFLCAAVACTSSKSPGASSGPPMPPTGTVAFVASATQTIGPAGGKIAIGQASLLVPAGALQQPQAITMESESIHASGGSSATFYRFLPDGLTFATAATVSLPGTAGVVHWSGVQDGQTVFTELPTTLAGGLATAPVTHFSAGYLAPTQSGAIDACETILPGGTVRGCPPGYSYDPANSAGEYQFDLSVQCAQGPNSYGLFPLVCWPVPQDAGTSSGSSPPSHFHVVVNGADVNTDCTKLDDTQNAQGSSLYSVGGQSASTSEEFFAWVPSTAAALASPSALGEYPIVSWNENGPGAPPLPAPFSLMLNVYDLPSSTPDESHEWFSCGPGQCGLPSPDPAHYQKITSIVEQPSSEPGMATFRISATFAAEVWKVTSPKTTTTATGDWSLLVSVPAPSLDAGTGRDGSALGTCASSCAGCCDPGGACHASSYAYCGTGGSACRSCEDWSTCAGGECVAVPVPDAASASNAILTGYDTCNSEALARCSGLGGPCAICAGPDASAASTPSVCLVGGEQCCGPGHCPATLQCCTQSPGIPVAATGGGPQGMGVVWPGGTYCGFSCP